MKEEEFELKFDTNAGIFSLGRISPLTLGILAPEESLFILKEES
tara:strand:- start:101 stop:232 length:132 start_codon:yes stop_codon:yes gene_type:complete